MRRNDVCARLRGDMERLPVPYQWNRLARAAAGYVPEQAALPPARSVHKMVWAMVAVFAVALLTVMTVSICARMPLTTTLVSTDFTTATETAASTTWPAGRTTAIAWS